MVQLEIRRMGEGDDEIVLAAQHLFDRRARPAATRRFLSTEDHHLLVAFAGDRAAGFVSGVEITHPDKGTEMLLYELGVDDGMRRRGIGARLVQALAALAASRGCHGMFVLVDGDNAPALATYRRAGGIEASRPVMVEWAISPER